MAGLQASLKPLLVRLAPAANLPDICQHTAHSVILVLSKICLLFCGHQP